ncbi:hypothetical protein JCM8115_004964 [Rhodotorula mucilaginosa]
MVKRKDAAQPAAKSPATTPPTAKVAPPQQRPPAAGGVAEQQQPSKFRFATLLFRIASLAFALYTLYKRMYPPPSTVDLDLDNKARIRHAPIERDPLRQDAVLEAFKHSYRAYEKDAFGSDDYHPISHRGSNMSPAGPVGYFLIDSLDSLLLTGLTDEYRRARDWVEKLSFDLDDKFHTFEVKLVPITIRVLGGLLSAYHYSGENDQMLLDKAVDLADRLLPAFETPSGLPMSFVNLAQRQGIPDPDNRGMTSVAEAGTLQLEFKYLSHLTGNRVYRDKVEKVMEVIRAQPSKDGLVPIFMTPDTGSFVLSDIRLGSRGDSYYEYLSKQYFQTNRTEPVYRQMHQVAMRGIAQHLVKKSTTRGLVYTSELLPRRNAATGQIELVDTPKQDHLVCFLGATLLLGVTDGNTLPVPPDESQFDEHETDDWYLGKQLIRTCVDTYVETKTGLAPEIVYFHTHPNDAKKYGREWFINSRKPGPDQEPPIDARNILRPETVESLFVAYRVTGDPIYREWGWKIFQAFEKHCRLPGGGYASIRDVDELPVRHEDRMETFWISETLKYLYLLFSDADVIPLDRYTLNTEAHPLPNFTPKYW